jgi:hypothetical protein
MAFLADDEGKARIPVRRYFVTFPAVFVYEDDFDNPLSKLFPSGHRLPPCRV